MSTNLMIKLIGWFAFFVDKTTNEDENEICVNQFSEPFKLCIKWRLSKDEFVFNHTSNVLYSKTHNSIYTSGEFRLAQNESIVYVCTPEVLHADLGFMDNVCSVYIRGMTVLFLCISIAVYLWLVRESRGINVWPIIFYKSSLFIYYICMILRFGGYSVKGAFWSNIIITIGLYAGRVAYCWLNVISFEMWRTFNPKRLLCNSVLPTPTLRRIFYQCLYSFGLPVTHIGTALLLGSLPLKIQDKWRVLGPTYGNIAQIIIMIVSLSTIALGNAIFCILVIVNIFKIRRDIQQTITTDNNKEMFLVYVKLVVLSDVVFFLYYIQIIYLHYFVFSSYWLVFDCISNSQGMWIFLIYCCNTTVCKLFRKKLVGTDAKASWSLKRH